MKRRIRRVVERIKHIRFHKANGDNDLVADPTNWDEDDFFHWEINGKPKSIATFTPEQKRQDEFRKASERRDLSVSTSAATTTTPTEPAIVLNEEVVLNLNIVNADDDDIDIDNAKSPSKYKILIRNLDGIKDEYYQVKVNIKENGLLSPRVTWILARENH